MRKQFECHAVVICQFNVTDLLCHSDAINRISSLTGFLTARSRWGGYSQSELKIKVCETQALKQNKSIKSVIFHMYLYITEHNLF